MEYTKFIYQSILTAWITKKAGLSAVTLLESANLEDRVRYKVVKQEVKPTGRK